MDNTELLKQFKSGDKKALDKLVENNLGLVSSITKKFNNRGYEYEDLFQVGCIGLMKAVNKFDLSQDVQFSTFVYPTVLGEIRKFIRDDNKNLIKLSRKTKILSRELYYKQLELSEKLGREATYSELASFTGYTVNEVKEAIVLTSYNKSFQEIHYSSGNGDTDVTLGETIDSGFNLEEEVIKKFRKRVFI